MEKKVYKIDVYFTVLVQAKDLAVYHTAYHLIEDGNTLKQSMLTMNQILLRYQYQFFIHLCTVHKTKPRKLEVYHVET